MKKEINTLNYYDGISKGYSNLYHEEQIQKISLIKSYLENKKTILDLGAGDGVLNKFVSGESQLVSFDLSFELLKLNNNNNKVQGSAMNLPFKDDSFDCISSFTMLQDTPSPIKALEEIKRVLKKDGIIILSFLRLTSQLNEILEYIGKKFIIIEKIEEVKDWIFVLKTN